MKCLSCSVLLLLFAVVDAKLWYDNDDFERVTQPLQSSLTQEYLRSLSIFKRKLQLLGFYPLVLNDDGLEYVSMDPYLIEDDDDDELYKLLKKMKKEKKARKKLQKKKKTKKVTETPAPPVETTTIQPVANIVYYWPSAITTIVHSGQDESTSSGTYQQTFDTRVSIDGSSEEDSSEVDANSNDQTVKIDKQKPVKINLQTSFTFGRKLDNNDETEIRATKAEALPLTTTTTTPYPLLTVFPDPEQEVTAQQETVNKISNDDQGNSPKTVSVEGQDHVDRTTTDATVTTQEEDNLTVTDAMLYRKETVQESSTYSSDEISPSETTTLTTDISTTITSIDVTTELSTYSTEPATSIPTAVLQFFHVTLPNDNAANGLPSSSEIKDNSPISSSTDTVLSDKVEKAAEVDTNIDGHRETDTQHNHSTVQLNEETTTTAQPLNEHSATPKPTDGESEGSEFLIDPKLTRPVKIIDLLSGFESRSLTDEPMIVAANDKNGRRSDVPIEADDINEEDATDNLAYNSTGNKLDENVVENTSAVASTTPPKSALAPINDNYDQFESEIIALIPIIIKQMKQGNVSPDEMEILKHSFGPFWPFIVEESSRDSDSSEEMNPMLSELLNSVNRKVVKREATFGRPIYGRRIYVDDGDDDVQYVTRRRYYVRRRRPYISFYKKK